jgi:hypothetical protein
VAVAGGDGGGPVAAGAFGSDRRSPTEMVCGADAAEVAVVAVVTDSLELALGLDLLEDPQPTAISAHTRMSAALRCTTSL